MSKTSASVSQHDQSFVSNVYYSHGRVHCTRCTLQLELLTTHITQLGNNIAHVGMIPGVLSMEIDKNDRLTYYIYILYIYIYIVYYSV